MRRQPDLSEGKLLACLRALYGLPVVSCRFLPIGYDLNAFVYEAITADERAYFVKVRDGPVRPPSALIPRFLIEQGVPNILAPLRTETQALWGSPDRYSVLVYPFIRGENAMRMGLTDRQWREFGATLKAIHSTKTPEWLREQVPGETFSIPSASPVRDLLRRIPGARFESPAAARLASFWKDNASLLERLLERAEALGERLQSRPFTYVLCHADIHAANILVGEDGRIYLIDWDDPMRAPRERDLLFVAGSRIGRPVEAREEALFFEGYGTAEIDRTALAYYRYERAIQDIGEAAQRVFWKTDQNEEEKAYEAERLRSGFDPGGIVESAMQADRDQGGPSSFGV
jgi:spectinomycin phosphotransferase